MRRPIGLSVPYRKKTSMFTPAEIDQMSKDSGMELYGLGRVRAQFLERLEAFARLAVAREKEKNK